MISASVQQAVEQPSSNQKKRIGPLGRARARKQSTDAINAASGVRRSSTHSVISAPPTRSPIQAANTPVASATTPTAAGKRRLLRAVSISAASPDEVDAMTIRSIAGLFVPQPLLMEPTAHPAWA